MGEETSRNHLDITILNKITAKIRSAAETNSETILIETLALCS